jgi:hypothetical protein
MIEHRNRFTMRSLLANHFWLRSMTMVGFLLASCGGTDAPAAGNADSGATADGGSVSSGDGGGGGGADGGACALAADTTPTSTTSANGCVLLDRDTSSCRAARESQGLSGFWLAFSCRVTLTKTASAIEAKADGQPDYKSFYFAKTNACYETWASGMANPNVISAQNLVYEFPLTPNTTSGKMNGGAVALALDGVPIFGNFAAPGDDIYQESQSFDKCDGHPQQSGQYHFHTEPSSLSQDDARFIGVMRDGYAIYGRKDADGTYPIDLDANGGHTHVTAESPSTAVYHYHVNQQTSMGARTAGQKAWFLTTGTYRGSPGACTGCM